MSPIGTLGAIPAMATRTTGASDRPVSSSIHAELIAVLVAIAEATPVALTVEDGSALPSGPLEAGHRSLQSGLRVWVEKRTGRPIGYVEQLYTFADSDRHVGENAGRTISISYLGLLRTESSEVARAAWRPWYAYFPWEDHRPGPPRIIERQIAPGLGRWARQDAAAEKRDARARRAAIAFGLDGRPWNEELTLQRYELLYEAGLVEEAHRKGAGPQEGGLGTAMRGDHRRILATGIARLRAKIKYNPVVFELMPPEFTLLQLQRCVEAIAGLPIHAPNFRRLIEQQNLVEETGRSVSDTGGRPAKTFCFRPAVLEARAAAGTKPSVARN